MTIIQSFYIINTGPEVPANLTVDAVTTSSVSLSWDAAPRAAGYKLYRNGLEVQDQVGLSYEDIDLLDDTAYTYTVSSYTYSLAESAESAGVIGTTNLVGVPANLSVDNVTEDTISLSWDAVTDAVGYRLYRDTILIRDQAGLTYNDTGRADGTSYTYNVSAYDAANNEGVQSGDVIGTTDVLFAYKDAVHMDAGATDYLSRADLVGLNNGTNGTISLWVQLGALADNMYLFSLQDNPSSGGHLWVWYDEGAERFRVDGTTSGTDLELVSNTYNTTNAWVHLLASWSSGASQMYINGIVSEFSKANPSNQIDYSREANIGAYNDAGLAALRGELANVYFTNEYINLSVASNRRKFSSQDGSGGVPVDLGDTGNLPTGTAAKVLMAGPSSIWNAGTNVGTGGDFTMTGSVTNSAKEPIQVP